MSRLAEDRQIEDPRRKRWKRMLWVAGAIGLVGVIAFPVLNGAVEQGYIKRCVQHRADTCAPEDRRRAEEFCRENPMAYQNDTSPPVQYRIARYGASMTDEEGVRDRCVTAYLYDHRNDGFFGGLLKTS